MLDPMNFYRKVVSSVPAYRNEIENHKLINVIEEIKSLSQLPILTKSNYLLEYPYEELCWPNELDKIHFIGSSSGFSKSGIVYWTKRPEDELDYMESIETMLRNNYQIDQKRTLIFCCMALGLWIGGMMITSTLRILATKGRNNITVVTPGLNLKEAVEIYERFHQKYEQTLWITNPSNISIITALIRKKNIDFKPASNFFPVVGEYYSETFREKVAQNYGHSIDSPFVVWTGYGSADTGDIAVETEATIKLRKYLLRNPELNKCLFKSEETPMILELSDNVFIEIIENQIIVTKDQLIPLVRYNTGDCGGFLEKDFTLDCYNIPHEISKDLPKRMLYVFGRATDNIIFYGTNLNLVNINNHFLSLPDEFKYSGLFQVKEMLIDELTHFHFTVYTEDYQNSMLSKMYYNELIQYLKSSSSEFETKFINLSNSIDKPLITLQLEDVTNLDVKIKHKFLSE